MTVSVVMPVYNSAEFLVPAIESVLGQTHGAFECLIVDDGSTDGTRAIARKYASADERVRLFEQPHGGVSAALNFAIGHAAHEWLAVMHGDDIMQPFRLERQTSFIRQNPGLAVASSFVTYIDRRGRSIGRCDSEFTTHAAVSRAIARGELVGFHHPAVLMRRSTVIAVGGYCEDLDVCEDIELWNRIADRERTILVQPEYLVKYRIHNGSASVVKRRAEIVRAEWVRTNANRRRAGQIELPWETFLQSATAAPWPTQLRRNRRTWGDFYYKHAAVSYANRDFLRLVPALAACLVLQPLRTWRDVHSKLRNVREPQIGSTA